MYSGGEYEKGAEVMEKLEMLGSIEAFERKSGRVAVGLGLGGEVDFSSLSLTSSLLPLASMVQTVPKEGIKE